MPITISTYTPALLDGMLALYNAETAFEPHIAVLTIDRFAELVATKSTFDPDGIFVAVEGGAVVGWVHACVSAGSERGQDPEKRLPRIRMLIYTRERLEVGAALVEEATRWLKGSGQKVLLAMHARAGYPFYRGIWMGGEPMCPITLPHVQLALEVGGYANTQESIFMTTEMRTPPDAIASPGIDLVESASEIAHEPMRESWIGFDPRRTRAMMGDDEIGGISWVIQPHLADRLGAPCMNIWGLGVSEDHRRKGMASALIASAMKSSFAMGARFASVGTQLWNAPAHATYAKLGYIPHTVLVGRTLDLNTQD